MKRVTVSAFIPSAIAHCAFQQATAEATSIPVGVDRALKQILRAKGVAGQRIHEMKLTVSISPLVRKEAA